MGSEFKPAVRFGEADAPFTREFSGEIGEAIGKALERFDTVCIGQCVDREDTWVISSCIDFTSANGETRILNPTICISQNMNTLELVVEIS